MVGDQSIATVRTPHRIGVLPRLQAGAVALLALVPLTASGHYLANVVSGRTTNEPDLVALGWLLMFSVLGALLVLAAVTSILPGWQRAGWGPVALLCTSAVLSTIDYWQLIDSPTGLALNAASLAIAVGAVQSIYWAPRSPLTSIALRPSERLQEWMAGVMLSGGVLAFALPHPSTIDDAPEDCAPLWIIVERDCLSADVPWWPIAVAAIAIGTTLLSVIHRDPSAPGRRSSPRTLVKPTGRGAEDTPRSDPGHHDQGRR